MVLSSCESFPHLHRNICGHLGSGRESKGGRRRGQGKEKVCVCACIWSKLFANCPSSPDTLTENKFGLFTKYLKQDSH